MSLNTTLINCTLNNGASIREINIGINNTGGRNTRRFTPVYNTNKIARNNLQLVSKLMKLFL